MTTASRFEVEDTSLEGLKVLRRTRLDDARGYFERLYGTGDLASVMGGRSIVQINRTLTSDAGVVRGMHFQHPPHAELKILSCLRGRIFDIVVDVRHGSSTFLRWHAEELSGGEHKSLLIPEGFAHGFQTLSDECELLYFHTAEYAPASQSGLHALDPRLAIAWPRPVVMMSARDEAHAFVEPSFEGVRL